MNAGEDCAGVYGRGNTHSPDLNRNFPDQYYDGNNNPDGWEPETVNMLKWIAANNFVLSSNLHGGAVVAVYPYDDTPSGTTGREVSPDNKFFERVAKTYSYNHPYMWRAEDFCHYSEHFKDGITNGAEWYSLSGGMQDWNYLHSNCFEILIEMACCKFPRGTELQGLFEEHYYSLFAFATQVHMGAKGFVVDEKKKPLIGAKITVEGIRHSIVSGFFGDFYRLLTPGKYNITASYEGKVPVTKEVVIEERDPRKSGVDFAHWATRVDFLLPSTHSFDQDSLKLVDNYSHNYHRLNEDYWMWDFNVFGTQPLTAVPSKLKSESRKMPYTDLPRTEVLFKTPRVGSAGSAGVPETDSNGAYIWDPFSRLAAVIYGH